MDINGYKKLLRAARKHVENAGDTALLREIDDAFPKPKIGLSYREIEAKQNALRAHRGALINEGLLRGETLGNIAKRLGISTTTVESIWHRTQRDERKARGIDPWEHIPWEVSSPVRWAKTERERLSRAAPAGTGAASALPETPQPPRPPAQSGSAPA